MLDDNERRRMSAAIQNAAATSRHRDRLGRRKQSAGHRGKRPARSLGREVGAVLDGWSEKFDPQLVLMAAVAAWGVAVIVSLSVFDVLG
jgi:hypothetical protein